MNSPTWRSVVNYEGIYEVSDQGQVRRVADLVLMTQRINWRWPRWFVRLTKDGVRSVQSVHVLVAEAFLGPRPEGHEVCHNDGDRDNNCLTNLRYDTHSGNMLDAVSHGTHAMAHKKQCPRGHDIRDSKNVRTRNNKKTECLSCSRANALASYYRRKGTPWSEAQVEADANRRYQELLAKPGSHNRKG